MVTYIHIIEIFPLFNPLCSPTMWLSVYGITGSLKFGFLFIAAFVRFFHYFIQKFNYLLVYLLSVLLLVFGILNDIKEFGVLIVQGFIEGLIVDFLQNCLQSIQGLLQYLVPVCVGNLWNYWHQKRECKGLIALQDGQEVIVLEEAHGSICHLEMGACNAFDESLEEFGDEWF